MNVCVVGAGASGLAAIKSCIEEGLNPTCFEMSSDIAGLWNYKNDSLDGRASVYKSTVTNTSKEISAFSDFPMPIEFPNYLHHSKFLEYYHLFAKHFNLIEKIKFNCKVMRISPSLDHRWIVSYKDNDAEVEREFDAVMICTGVLWKPYEPVFRGLNEFKGEVIHGLKYRDPIEFKGKSVLVIGLGNSGCDIGVELAKVATNVYMSVHHGLWCASRLGLNGMPNDLALSRFALQIGNYFPNYFENKIKRRLNARFDHHLYGLEPPDNVSIKRITF